jgi:hypothetical protein
MSDDEHKYIHTSSSSAFKGEEISVYDNGSVGIGMSDP